jgi:hypothetical protein
VVRKWDAPCCLSRDRSGHERWGWTGWIACSMRARETTMRTRFRRALGTGAAAVMLVLPALVVVVDGAKRWPGL